MDRFCRRVYCLVLPLILSPFKKRRVYGAGVMAWQRRALALFQEDLVQSVPTPSGSQLSALEDTLLSP